MVLETETGELYQAKYLPRGWKLSGGWRKFAMDMKLEEGDAVVFQLVEPTKFKVYFIRANSTKEVKLPLHLLNLVKQSASAKADNDQLIVFRRGKVNQISENHIQKSSRLVSRNAKASLSFHKGIDFSNITNFEEFKAVMQELLQDYELPYNTLHDYYKLCRSQNAFLHANVFKEFNSNLSQMIVWEIKRIIFDTVRIARALTTCELCTFFTEYASWDQDLSVYEALGMNVGFLRARLHLLVDLAFNSEGAADRRRYKEASHERGHAEGEVRKLEVALANLRMTSDHNFASESKSSWLVCAKAEISNLEALLAELRKFFRQYDAHIETLKLKAKIHELNFQDEVSAPW